MRNRYLLLADIALIAVVAFVAFALRFDFGFLPTHRGLWPFILLAVTVKPIVFLLFGMYSRYWRYATLQDMLAVAVAVPAASLLFAAAMVVGVTYDLVTEFSRAVWLIDCVLTLVAVVAVRVAVRLIGETFGRDSRAAIRGERKRVLVVGAGEAGTLIVREMRRNPQLGMEPVGFIDDAPSKIGKRILGIPVLGSSDRLDDVITRLRVNEVVIAMPKAAGPTLRRIADVCRTAGVSSRTMPGIFEILDGQVSVSRLRQVDIADLLRRDQVLPDPAASLYVAGKRVLVTGAGGSIGFELCRQLAHAGPERLILVGHGENSIFDSENQLREAFPDQKLASVIVDVRDRSRLARVVAEHLPHIVFHAAAHKHVPLMEANPEEAITNNVIGTRNLIDASIDAGVERFVLISTDKAVAPSNMMGASKRIAEALVRRAALESGRSFAVVRFGNVLGSRGSVVPLMKRQIERGGPVTVTHQDMSRFFMTIPEAVHLVLQAGGMARGGELFVLKMGDPVRIVDLVHDLIHLSGYQLEEVPIRFTGLRPGEKLEEALWEPNGTVAETRHPEILSVTERHAEHRDLSAAVERLAQAAASADIPAMETVIAELVPTFAPSWLRDGTATLK